MRKTAFAFALLGALCFASCGDPPAEERAEEQDERVEELEDMAEERTDELEDLEEETDTSSVIEPDQQQQVPE